MALNLDSSMEVSCLVLTCGFRGNLESAWPFQGFTWPWNGDSSSTTNAVLAGL